MKTYSPIGNRVVWYGVDSNGNEVEIDKSIIQAPPSEKIDGTFKDFAKTLGVQKGEKGESGYAQNKFTWNCYNNHEEVKSLVENWFKKNLEDKTISESLCYYNEGIIKSSCPYYEKYLRL